MIGSSDELKSLVLNDTSFNYHDDMSSFSDAHHPLASTFSAVLADSDPLLTASPPPLRHLQNPNAAVSYSDVAFNPFDGEINGAVSLSQSPPSSSSFDYVRITVSDPQKEQQHDSTSSVITGNAYVTYLITTRTSVSDFGVRRRFRDVVALSERLSEAYRGLFIPPRPDKNVVERRVMQKEEFVEQRRVALEKYLRRLAAHPVIKKSDELKAFLTMTNAEGCRMMDEAGHVAKGGRNWMRMFKEMRQSVAVELGGLKPMVREDDEEFTEKKEHMKELEQELINASRQVESLVKAQEDMGDTMGDLGLAFIKLSKFESEEALFNSQRVRAADMKNVATAAVKASRYYRELNSQTVKHFETFHEYLGVMLSVNDAFSDRSSALLTVQTLLSELGSLQSRAEKLEAASNKIFGGDRSRTRKLEELNETIRAAEDAKNVAIREYERIKENNRSELERLDHERHADFLNMLEGFVHNQVEYAEKIAHVWSNVAEETSSYARESL